MTHTNAQRRQKAELYNVETSVTCRILYFVDRESLYKFVV